MQRMKQSTTSTVFLFCSPQFMIKYATFLWADIHCAQTGTLRVADKAYIFAIYGASFCVEIRILCTVFYKPVFAMRYHPVFIALMATMSERNLQYFVDLTTIYFLPASRIWGPPDSFAQSNVTITQWCSSKYIANFDHIVAYLPSNSGSAFVFANSKALTHHLRTSLEGKSDKQVLDVDPKWYLDPSIWHNPHQIKNTPIFQYLVCSHSATRSHLHFKINIKISHKSKEGEDLCDASYVA